MEVQIPAGGERLVILFHGRETAQKGRGVILRTQNLQKIRGAWPGRKKNSIVGPGEKELPSGREGKNLERKLSKKYEKQKKNTTKTNGGPTARNEERSQERYTS